MIGKVNMRRSSMDYCGGLTLNLCQWPLPETHSSQNQFVNLKQSQLYLEVTWFVRPSKYLSDPAAMNPKLQCTFDAFKLIGVPQPIEPFYAHFWSW